MDCFQCKRCKNDKFCVGKKAHNRRCTKCRYDESPTANTIFNKLKFSILLAFHIAFKISTKPVVHLEIERKKDCPFD